jgi:LytR cell envelope-related transcriptional attenuator
VRRPGPRVRTRRHDERGIAVSSPIALLSAAAVVVAGVAFVATGGPRQAPAAQAVTPAAASPSPSAASRAPVAREKHVAKRVVRRGDTYVEVFNNSGIKGLAGSTAARAQGAGWQVVGSDNWYGTIPASTVYYPARLHAQAVLLAKDLGIGRVKPVIDPMRGDRLTVILTSDYS